MEAIHGDDVAAAVQILFDGLDPDSYYSGEGGHEHDTFLHWTAKLNAPNIAKVMWNSGEMPFTVYSCLFLSAPI